MARKSRTNTRITVADPRLNAVVRRHLRALGQTSAETYIAWCRRHGFSPRLNKTLPQRQEELKAAKKLHVEEQTQTTFQKHLEALGLETTEAYQTWCRRHGFGEGIHKSRVQRQQELRYEDRNDGQVALALQHKRRRRDTVELIARGKIEEHELTSPLLQNIYYQFDVIGDQQDVRDAFLRLLLDTEKRADFFHVKPVVPSFGPQPDNTFLGGLCTLAYWHSFWLRDVESWKPASHNDRRQFGAFARYLLAKYDVPACMDSAWFRGIDDTAQQQQDWFIHIGSGRNIRKADIPLIYSKRMAHTFLQAPAHFTVTAALRWAQVIGLGGDEPLAEAVIETRLGEHFHDEDFWGSVLYFFINNPMLDPAYLGPIVDYIYQQRYVPQETIGPDGEVEEDEPAEPNFTMKGRTVDSILRRVNGWHRELVKEQKKTPRAWAPSGINGFDYVDEDRGAGEVRSWTLEEVLNSQDLYEEGKEMHNCVASYQASCIRAQKSIWSLKVEYLAAKVKRRVLTISINNRTRHISQVRGRNNTLPYKSESDRYIAGWALVQKWAEKENLSMPRVWAREMQPL